MKKLEDYPAVPDTPPPQDKKEKTVCNLENELNQEKNYLEALAKENKEIERIVLNLDKQISYIKGCFPQNVEEGVIHADNKFWFKYQAQVEVNRKLAREKKHLETEIRQIEEQGVVNLDSLTQAELILYVKQLERTKTDLTSELRAAEWSLDKQAKESHHLEQIRGELDAEIRHYDEELAMFRHYNNKNSCPSATTRSSLQVSTLRNDVNFSSFDEGSTRRNRVVQPTPGFHRRTIKGAIPGNQRILDPQKGPINKKQALGSLPSLKSETPHIVVTDTSGTKTSAKETGKIVESPLDIKRGPLSIQNERNFENSPPPRPSSTAFSFDEDTIGTPVAEVSQNQQVTIELGNNRTLTIQIVVKEVTDTCDKCKNPI